MLQLKYSKMEPSETTFGAKMVYHDALFRGKVAPPQ
jgi:hypothetical protein